MFALCFLDVYKADGVIMSECLKVTLYKELLL